ncbi:glycogen debranching protein [Candidatus Bathyarchaeota archaeon A05DMB-2]|jgi:predicted glycogen debranching enzyme|nr:glycogen debranching protein [Candidatus Bathyarchaeota archaeon A05DMB-2]
MKLSAITLTHEALSSLDECIQKEWLVTNGLGGYASSTVLGVNTRKYHGLLVAALHPPGDRTVCLSKLDEEARVGNNIYPLGANEFQGKIFPQGYLSLKEFSISPFPRYVYSMEDVEVKKTVFMPRERNATVTVYSVANGSDSEAKLSIYPLLSCRHFHSVVDRKQSPLEFSQTQNSREVELAFTTPKASVIVRATSGTFTSRPIWLDRLFYREEAARGESSIDDCYQPGFFEVVVPPRRRDQFAIVVAANANRMDCMEDLDAVGFSMYDVDGLMRKELDACEKLLDGFYGLHKQVPMSDWLNWLLLATDAFIVKGVDVSRSVLAGYYWFESWGRDTFVSLPGLMLTTGRFEEAKKIFLQFARHSKQGLIPNYIQDRSGEPAYNTVDATLWYVNAVLQYLKYTGDYRFVQKHLWDDLKAVIAFHEKGTSYSIRVDGDGLLAHGPQLTWMDAAVDGNAVTPRAGKAVEVQALWYNALRTMQRLAGRFDETGLAEKYGVMAKKARASFNLKFWNNQANCLFDVVSESGADASLRPNQIIAASLDFAVLDRSKTEQVVDVVQRELLTPFGLRTLARSDGRYHDMYVGDRRSRDQAYHNGTVWPWLLGPFTTAFLKVKGHADYRVEHAKNFFLPLFTQQLSEAGLGTLSEIFDGEPPHQPRGCVAQAWSVAEPLRAYVEDVMQVRPRYELEVLQL